MKSQESSLVTELRQMYATVPPAPKGLVEGRQRMLEAAALLRPAIAAKERRERVPLMRRFSRARAFRALSVLLVVIFIVTATSGGVILASGSSLPGERLYPVKLGVEDICLSWTADPTMQVERNLDYVTERVEEMKGLAEQGEEIPGAVVTRMEAQMDQAVGYTLVVPEAEASGLVEEMGKRMVEQQGVLEEIKAGGMEKEEAGALDSALRLAERVKLAAELAEGDPLRMQNVYRQLGEQEEPAGPESQNRDRPGEMETAMEAEEFRSQHRVARADSPDEGESPSETEIPGQETSPEASGYEAPAGENEMGATSSGSGVGASSAKAVKAGRTASAEAPKGKGR